MILKNRGVIPHTPHAAEKFFEWAKRKKCSLARLDRTGEHSGSFMQRIKWKTMQYNGSKVVKITKS